MPGAVGHACRLPHRQLRLKLAFAIPHRTSKLHPQHWLSCATPTTPPAARCYPAAANRPMIVHQIEALKEAGCDEVVLAINYRPQVGG